jgi:phage-related tail protein
MTTTGEKLKDAVESTADAAKGVAKDVAKDTKGIAHKIGKALKDGANEVAAVAGQTLETVGRQMKDTTKDKPSPEK